MVSGGDTVCPIAGGYLMATGGTGRYREDRREGSTVTRLSGGYRSCFTIIIGYVKRGISHKPDAAKSKLHTDMAR